MQLTLHSDYALRTLMYLELKGDAGATVGEVAEHYGISKNHLVKVVHELAGLGYVRSARGRNGGLHLGAQAESINLAEVVEAMEPNFHLVECFDMKTNTCPIAGACRLKRVLAEAHREFLRVLGQYSLADVCKNRNALAKSLALGS